MTESEALMTEKESPDCCADVTTFAQEPAQEILVGTELVLLRKTRPAGGQQVWNIYINMTAIKD